jgi:hypothetical protein
MQRAEGEAEKDQEAMVRFLSDPATYGVKKVDYIKTHAAHVFLAGDRVWKLKRAVTYGFLDFSTLDERRKAITQELELNRRTAPGLYLEVIAVTKSDGKLTLGGKGLVQDWLLVMQRFEQASLFDHMARGGLLTPALITGLGDDIAAFHQRLEPLYNKGGAARMGKSVADVLAALQPCIGPVFEPAAVAGARDLLMAKLDRIGPLLDKRRDRGLVRFCHGDMHLANICLWQGRATPFDCIEFNDDIASADLLHDLAFPVMDLVFFKQSRFANLLLNRYLEAMQDYNDLAVLPFFLAARAIIRAMASGLVATEKNAETPRRYLGLVKTFLAPPKPCLIAVGGLSGSGKSSLGRELAIETAAGAGAITLRSDGIRKRLLGRLPEEKLPPSGYRPEMNVRVYEILCENARNALKAGFCVIADAAHLRQPEREKIAEIAKTAGVPFHGLWLDLPPDVARARLRARSGDASDAGIAVYERQLGYDTGDITWHRLDAAKPLPDLCRLALDALRTSIRPAPR